MLASADEDTEVVAGARNPRELLDIKSAYAAWIDSDMNRQIDAWAHQQGSGYDAQGISNTPEDRIDSLKVAQNFWVADDMVTLTVAAQATMPDVDVLLQEPPSPHGYLILATPIRLPHPDHFGKVMSVNGLHWRPVHRSLPDTFPSALREHQGLLLQWLHVPEDPDEHRLLAGHAPFSGGVFLPQGVPIRIGHDPRLGVHATDPTSDVLTQHARAMWILMQQQIASIEQVDGYRKQQEKAHKLEQVATVSVVTLRRASPAGSPADGPNNVDWSHRWMVRGHWRNHWHPRLQQHRPMWIADHVKGPEDAPLVIKDKINLWRR